MAINGIMMQYFEWNLGSGYLWKQMNEHAGQLAEDGITALWIPPAYKGMHGQGDVGYTGYDLYDLGEFDQKGGKPTKYGTKRDLISAIRALHDKKIHVYADIVLDHKMGAEETEHVQVREHDVNNRNISIGDPFWYDAWTKFYFPGRKGAYSNFEWNWTHFDAVDKEEEFYGGKKQRIFVFESKRWSSDVDLG